MLRITPSVTRMKYHLRVGGSGFSMGMRGFLDWNIERVLFDWQVNMRKLCSCRCEHMKKAFKKANIRAEKRAQVNKQTRQCRRFINHFFASLACK